MVATQNLCHRCSSALPEDALFCAACGAPQLVLTETDAQRVSDERAAKPSGEPVQHAHAAGRIRWRPVIRIVSAIAAVAGVTAALGAALPGFAVASTVIVCFAPMLSLRFYQRIMPGAPMRAGIGARIGLVLGVMLAFVRTAVNAAGVVLYRYSLHNGAKLDQEFVTTYGATQQRMAEYAANYPETYGNAAQGQHILQFLMMTPDGRAGMMLMGSAFMAAIVLVWCVLLSSGLGWMRRMPVRGKAV